ncbi:hypothetical protein ElyMa_006134900 [Elysia marginata]|uniref:CABIT domain-containing protein n=1 Tax=Elysia marginata TaxID=1093978 RepID=A0AAV4GXB9_9GAST|nr:hypothetical protein ElyMa_006134900 [Elysia marginata]
MSKISKQSPAQYGRSISEEIPPPSRPPPVLSSRFEPDFNTQSEVLADIAKNLPRVVKCDRSTVRSTRLPFDLSQSLLLHSKRSVIKVGARSVLFDKEKGRFQDVGDDILVPEDYPGWFGVIGSPKDIKSESTVPYYRTIGKLGITNCREFLVGGTHCVNGFTRIAGNQSWEYYKVPPGEVLRRVGVYQERKKLRSGGIFSSRSRIVIEVYLRCYDTRDRDIHISANEEGVFYILTQDGPMNKTPVMTMSQIVQRYRNNFPLVVKLLFGPVPKAKCAFKDTLRLNEVAMSHTVIASTMENLRNINLEIPLDDSMRFYAAIHSPTLTESRLYKQAYNDCEAKAPTYKRNMKVLVGVILKDDLPPPPPLPESTNPPSGTESYKERRDEACSDGSPVAVRRDTSRRYSRLSVISRIITLNSVEQSDFAANIPPSPEASPSPQNKQLSLKHRKRTSSKNSMPGQLDLVEDYKPPEEPETIQADSTDRSMSEEGRKRLQKYINSKDGPSMLSHYEQPGSLLISNEDSEDSNIYGAAWQSSSIKRTSGAGIRIPSKPGKPTDPQAVMPTLNENNMQSDFDPPPLDLNGLTLDHVPDAAYLLPSPEDLPSPKFVALYGDPQLSNSARSLNARSSPFSSQASSLSLSSNADNGELQTDNFQGQDNQSQYENTISSSPAFPTPPTSIADVFNKQPYHATVAEAASYQHVYNDLYDGQQRTAQVLQSNLPILTPHASGEDRYCSPIDQSTNGIDGDYITPLETNHYATPEDHSNISNPYEPPSAFWQESDPIGDGFALFRFQNVEPRAGPRREIIRDSGVETDEFPNTTPEQNPYDHPTVSDRQSIVAPPTPRTIYDTPYPENPMLDALQRKLQERNTRMNSISPPLSSETATSEPSSSLAKARPVHLDINLPPPLPSNHPSLTPNKAAFSLVSSIHNTATPPPETCNKDVLIEELRKTGLKSSSELAFQALQDADVTMLVQRKDDLDDVLITLLPSIGAVDLSKISMCIKNMVNKISQK